MKFSELELHPDLARGIEDAGYVDCMPVQELTFPHAFAGEDIYAQSQTGTGKTAAFLVSIFQRIMTHPESRNRKVLILAPTRELAVQIEAEAKKLGKHLGLSIGAFYGGVSYGPQVDMLRADVQFIIGTPGRIIDLIQQGKMLLKEVGFLVIDEADRMFDMGFIDDLRKLLRYLPPPKQRQTYLFSATLNFRVKNLAWEYMDEPKEILIEPEQVTVDLVTQELYHVGAHEKFKVLLGLLERENPESAIVFCNQKFMAEEVSRRLGINGIDCEFIMGDLPQKKRLEVIEKLKAGKLRILVATDVAARGLDVDALDLVVNYDVPQETESYVHRIGRTARAGKAGKAITLACEKFVFGLPAIEKYIDAKIPTMAVTEELLHEDKSEGMRFGHSRDRARPGSEGRTRHGERPPRRGEGPARHGERHPRPGESRGPGGRNQEPRRAPGAAPTAGTREAPRRPERRDDRRPVERNAAGRDGRRDEAPREGNPYAMSSEERMRRYKEKYGQAAVPGEARQSENRDRKPEARRDDRRDGGKPAPRGEGRAGERRGNGSDRSRNGGDGRGRQAPAASKPEAGRPRRPDVQPSRPAAGSAAPKAAPKKPGLIDTIKGLFGLGKKK